MCARLLARDAGAAPWVEEGLAAYFEAIPSEGAERLRAGRVHEPSAGRMKSAIASGDFTTLWKFVLLDRKAFDEKASLHRAQAWTLVHFLRHGPEGRRDYMAGYFKRLGEGKRGRKALGDLDWRDLEGAWKSHVRQVTR